MRRVLKKLFGRTFITALLILLQVGWLALLIVKLADYSVYISVAFTALSVLMMLYLVRKDENPAYKIGWLVLIGILPLFGGLMYLFVGNKRPARRIRAKLEGVHARTAPLMEGKEENLTALHAAFPRAAGTAEYLNRQGAFPLWSATGTRYYPIGEAFYTDLLKDLKKAEHFIFIEFFIIAGGKMWGGILDILRQKSADGVDVRVIYDDVGSIDRLPMGYAAQLEEMGISCLAFNPFIPVMSMAMNNRDHRKIVVIDGHTAYSGGVNLGDEYINELPRFGHWKDNGFRLHGEGVCNYTVMFLEMWNAFRKTDDGISRFKPHAYHQEPFEADGFVQPFGDSPLDGEALSENVYLELLNQAQKRVYIYTPYLAISHEMHTALVLAAKRGVDARLMTPGIPDKPLVYRLTRSHYRPLLEAGVRIYEYSPGFLHAKSYLCDDELAVVGTINMDFRSLYLHFECGTVFYGSSLIGELREDMADTMEKSREVGLSDCRQGFFGALVDAVLRVFAPLL